MIEGDRVVIIKEHPEIFHEIGIVCQWHNSCNQYTVYCKGKLYILKEEDMIKC